MIDLIIAIFWLTLTRVGNAYPDTLTMRSTHDMCCHSLVGMAAGGLAHSGCFINTLNSPNPSGQPKPAIQPTLPPDSHNRERERDLLQVPHFFVGTLQPL